MARYDPDSLVNKTHINNVFDTSTINMDQRQAQLQQKDSPRSIEMVEPDESSILVAETINQQTLSKEENGKQVVKNKKCIGHYQIGKL